MWMCSWSVSRSWEKKKNYSVAPNSWAIKNVNSDYKITITNYYNINYSSYLKRMILFYYTNQNELRH